jgi:hypothetical protein
MATATLQERWDKVAERQKDADKWTPDSWRELRATIEPTVAGCTAAFERVIAMSRSGFVQPYIQYDTARAVMDILQHLDEQGELDGKREALLMLRDAALTCEGMAVGNSLPRNNFRVTDRDAEGLTNVAISDPMIGRQIMIDDATAWCDYCPAGEVAVRIHNRLGLG